MKILIASDIHGSAKFCRELISAFEREKADKILLLGDLLYHGPRNTLPGEYDTFQVIDMLNGLKDKILCVRGNCDTEVDQMVLKFPIMADYCTLFTGSHMVFATHGHHYNKSSLPPMEAGDILLHGHTHVPAWDELGDGKYYLNPGSVSIPKERSCNSYMTFEDDVFLWKSLNGEVYHTLTLK